MHQVYACTFSARGATRESRQGAAEEDQREENRPSEPPPGIPHLPRWRRSYRLNRLVEAVSDDESSGRAQPAGQPSSPPYWLIVGKGPKRAEVLTIDGAGGGSMLPLFSFEQGAWEFLQSAYGEEDWRARPIGIVELLSVLRGPCAEVERVAVDPLPELMAEGMVGLVSLSHQSFVDSLLGRGRSWFDAHYSRKRKADERG